VSDRRERFETSSGIPVERVYGGSGGEEPGAYPFTRGIQKTMYRARLWTMRQYSGFGTAEQTNRRFRYLLEQGQSGLSVAFDLPTQMGYDSDHAMAAGEVGKVGVAISSIHDMEELLDGIPLDRVSTSMTINATASILLALYVAVAKRRKVDPKDLSGTVQNDLLKEYIARGTYIYPPEASLRITTDIFAWSASAVPKWNTISISGYHMREAGATAVQEVAFTLANAIAYCDAAIARGLPFATIAKERFGAPDELAKLRFHTQTAGSTLTAQQPEVNVVRTAYQALAAILGGTQSLHTNSMDEALGLPTESAALLALRTQQVLAHETGVADTVDPLGGSYFVESLTDAVEAGASAYLEKIDGMGGAVPALTRGFQQREIHEAAYRWQKRVESRDAIVVGVNAFTGSDHPKPAVLRVDAGLERERRERLAQRRKARNAAGVETSLAAVERAARGSDNLMPAILAAVEAEATLGEIADRMRAVFGTHRDAAAF